MKTFRNVKEAFTIVETMIVVAIVAFLAAIAVPNFLREKAIIDAHNLVVSELSVPKENIVSIDRMVGAHGNSLIVTFQYAGENRQTNLHTAVVSDQKIVRLDGKLYPSGTSDSPTVVVPVTPFMKGNN